MQDLIQLFFLYTDLTERGIFAKSTTKRRRERSKLFCRLREGKQGESSLANKELKSLSELGAEIPKVSLPAGSVKTKRALMGIKVVPRTSVLDGGFSF